MNAPQNSPPPGRSLSEPVFLFGSLLFGLLVFGGILHAWKAHHRLPSVRFGYSHVHQRLIDNNTHYDSLHDFQTAALIDFDNPGPQLQLLATAYELDNAESVAVALRGLLNHTPEDADLHARLAVALLQLGRPEEGLLHIKRAVKLDATQPGYFTAYGAILLALERIPEAKASYRKALELDPDSETALSALESLPENP
jgi:tetratricopeptide (TPR) repeat protein